MKHRSTVSTLAAAFIAATLVLPAPALAAGPGGGGAGGGEDTTGSDYSDLVVLLRAADGTPVLKKYVVLAEDPADPPTVEYCVQPVSYDPVPGVAATPSEIDGRDVYVLPLQGEWILTPVSPLPVAEIEPCDAQPQFAMFVSEVELERLNMARTSDDVIDDKLAAVETKLLAAGGDILLDPAGRITPAGVPIDAAPEHAAIYQSLMRTGTIPGLPDGMTEPTLVGPEPEVPNANSQFDAWELAAAAVGTAASKGVPITVDTVEYYNQVIGFPPDTATEEYASPWGVDFLRSFDPDLAGTRLPDGRRYVDYRDFSYNRSETFRGSVTWLDVLNLEWNVTPILEAVPFTRKVEVGTRTLTGVEAFAQLADDTRATILYLHDNEVVLPGFYMDPVGVDTTVAQQAAIRDPAVDLGALPETVFQTQPFGITASLFNPHPPTGLPIDNARLRITVDAGDTAETALTAGQVAATATDGQPLPFVEESGDLVGWWGPDTGFLVEAGYNASTTFEVIVAGGAPVGPYDVTLELVDLDTAATLATDVGTIDVNANVQTLIWGGEVPSLATLGSYVPLPLRVFAPEAGTGQLELTVSDPDSDPATALTVGDVKVFGSNGATMVAMNLAPDTGGNGQLVGTWDMSLVPGYNDVVWYLVVATDAPEGGYALDVRLVGGNALETVLIAMVAGEDHSQNPGTGGEDTTAPVVKVEVDGALGTSASFLLTTETVETGTSYSCRLTKDDVAGAWEDCTADNGGSKSYVDLQPGSYVFSARALDEAGNSSDVVTRSWTVPDGQGPGGDFTAPVVLVQANGVPGTSASFTLTTQTAEDGVTFECRLSKNDAAAVWQNCTSGSVGSKDYTGLEPGSYVFSGRASDASGNLSDVVTKAWMVPVVVDETAPETSLVDGPAENAWVLARSARFHLGSDLSGAQYRMTVNDRDPETCNADECVVNGLRAGRNRIRFAAMVGDLVDESPAVRNVFVPRSAFSLERSAGWRMREGDAHLFGKYVQTRQRGEVLKHWFGNIKRVALVASTGERYGKVHVYLGRNRLTDKPIDLSGYGARRMRLLEVASFANAQQGVVRVVVVSKDKVVRIDGLGIASR